MPRILLKQRAEVVAEYSFRIRKSISIGSSKRNNIVIPEKNISETHCVITNEDGKFTIQDNKTIFGTRVNDKPIAATSQELNIGDTINLGNYSLVLKDDRPTKKDNTPSDTTPSRYLLGIYGNFEGKKYELKNNGDTFIGRESVNPRGNINDIVLNKDMTVSKGHAKISCTTDICTITDVGSTGGVALNGTKVGQYNTANLKINDELTIARTVFRFTEGEIENYDPPKKYNLGILKFLKKIISYLVVAVYIFLVFVSYNGFVGMSIINNKPSELQVKNLSSWDAKGNPERAVPADYDISASPAIGDVNNDGTNDLVYFSPSGFLFVWDGKTGNQIWDPVEIYNSGKCSPAIADVNGDGVKDIVVVSDSSLLYIIDGKSGGIILKEMLGGNISELSPVVTDLNNDGKSDIVVCSEDGMVHFLYSDKTPGKFNKFTEFVEGPVYASPAIISTAKISPIVVVSGYNSNVYLFDGRNRTKKTINLTEKTGKVHLITATPGIGDINGDGVPELIVQSNVPQYISAVDIKNFKVYWTYFVEPIPPSGLKHTASPIVINYPGSGDSADVVCFSANSRMYLLKGDTGFSASEVLVNYEIPDAKRIIGSPAVYDFNKNGIPDLVICTEDGVLHIIEPSSESTEARELSQIGLNSSPVTASVVIGDLSGNGKLNIITVDLTNKIDVFETNAVCFKNKIVWQTFLGNALRNGEQTQKETPGKYVFMLFSGITLIAILALLTKIISGKNSKKRPKVIKL